MNGKRFKGWMLPVALLVLAMMLGVQRSTAQMGGFPWGGRDNGKTDLWKIYHVVVVPSDTTLPVGGELNYKAFLVDSTGARKNADFLWSFAGRPVGILTPQGHFKALAEGKGLVVATAGRISGKAQVTVQGGAVSLHGYRVAVTPKDTVLKAGDTVLFHAVLLDTADKPVQAAFTWQVIDPRVGKIDGQGKFTALGWGQTPVLAKTGDRIGKANVVVLRDSIDWWRKHLRYEVVVTPRDTSVRIGAKVQYKAVLLDSSGKPVTATFKWSLEESGLGSLDENGLFTAQAKGQGSVFATSGEFSGKARVTVIPDSGWGRDFWKTKLMVQPKDTLVAIGATVQYAAYLVDAAGAKKTVPVRWSLAGGRIGTISQEGLFKASARGMAVVMAMADGRYSALARIMVALPQDLTRRDSVHVRCKDRDDRMIGDIRPFGDTDVFKISGLPFPLNFLNGGELVFPPGSVDPNIFIDITLPDLAQIRNDTTVDFLKGILTGARFHVYVAGKLVSPYVFKEPVQIVLPYRAELLNKLGLTPDHLWAFFYTATGQLDSSGISSVVVDTTENKIYITVSHFSDIVVANRTLASPTVVESQDRLPGEFRLYENYPNPFNPETQIRFDVAGRGLQKVKLSIYDILGREIRVLADRSFAPGSHEIRWDGKDSFGTVQGSGVYFLRMESAEATLTQRMVMMK